MPLVYIRHIGDEAVWGLWEIRESITELLHFLSVRGISYPNLQGKSTTKLKESIAARVLVQELAQMMGLQGGAISKDAHNCPFWERDSVRLSISHTEGFAAALIHRTANSCGIDIEHPHERIRKIAPRVFSSEELAQASDLESLTTIWCAKEALYKWHKVGSLDFRTQLKIRLENQQIKGLVQSADGTVARPLLFCETYKRLVAVYCWL